MKQTKLFAMSALGILALASTQTVSAQTYQWTGTTPATAAAASGDAATVYLVNVGKYNANTIKNGVYWLGRGGKWGTEAVLSNTPFAFTVQSGNTEGTYRLESTVQKEGTTGNGVLGFMNGNGSDIFNYYVDRGRQDAVRNLDFHFEQVSTNPYVYKIHNDGFTITDPLTITTSNATTLVSNYSPNGNVFYATSKGASSTVENLTVNWSSGQGIYAEIDLTNSTNSLGEILGVSSGDNTDVSKWANGIHLYYPNGEGTNQLKIDGFGTGGKATMNVTGTITVVICSSGLYVNGEQKLTGTGISTLLNSTNVQIGSAEGNNRSNATYNDISIRTIQVSEATTRTVSYYMVAGYNNESTDNATTTDVDQRINGFESTALPTDNTDEWMLVTLAQLKEYFNQVDAAEADPAIATFLLTDPDFGRNDQAVTNWKTGSDASGTLSLPTTANSNNSDTPTTPSTQSGYYVGNGFVMAQSNQETYGHQWTASIKGDGQISQTITPIRKGWYAVRVNASVFGTGNGVLYASYGGSTTTTSSKTPYAEVAIGNTEELPTSYAAGEEVVNDGDHMVYVMVYVDDNLSNLTLGVKVSGSTDDTWTCIDNFQLYYHGDPQNVVLLDETRTDLEYINAQNTAVNNNKTSGDNPQRQRSTVYLKRAMNAGKWNSFVVPFAISEDDIYHVFGSNTVVSELKGATNAEHPNRIYFEKVNNIAAGKLYIIKPANSQPTNQAKVESSALESGSTTKPLLTFEAGSDYWTFNSASFGQDADYVAKVTGTTGAETYSDGGTVTFVGTYVSDSKSASTGDDMLIPANSYVIAYSNTSSGKAEAGKWYFRTKATKTKGFRGWLEQGASNAGAKVEFSINGVVEYGETTGIEGLTDEPTVQTKASGVYNLSGQLVRKGSSTVGLSQGIYIVNGRKYVVR